MSGKNVTESPITRGRSESRPRSEGGVSDGDRVTSQISVESIVEKRRSRVDADRIQASAR